jgi:hypothetical protein
LELSKHQKLKNTKVKLFSKSVELIRFLQTANTTITPANNSTTIIHRQCYTNSDCLGGQCHSDTGICDCPEGFQTLWANPTIKTNPDNTTVMDYSNNPLCTYQQKSQLTAFMLSMFVGFGAEHFYMERMDSALAKLFFYIGCCAMNIFYFIVYKCFPSKRKYLEFLGTFETLYLGCGVFFMLLWNIYDWVNIGYNAMLDGHGISLLPW